MEAEAVTSEPSLILFRWEKAAIPCCRSSPLPVCAPQGATSLPLCAHTPLGGRAGLVLGLGLLTRS